MKMKIEKTKRNALMKVDGIRGLWVRRERSKNPDVFRMTSLMDPRKFIYVPFNHKVELV